MQNSRRYFLSVWTENTVEILQFSVPVPNPQPKPTLNSAWLNVLRNIGWLLVTGSTDMTAQLKHHWMQPLTRHLTA